MDVNRLFHVVSKEQDKFINQMHEQERMRFIIKKVNMVNLYSLKKFKRLPYDYFYNLVRLKRDLFVKEIGFQCKNCIESCCFFTEHEDNVHTGVMLYKGDIDQLKKNNMDLKGITSLEENINPNIYIRYGMTVDIFIELLNKAGFLKSIKLIKKQNILQCYYFDEAKQKCKIHKYKPITCYLFPYVMALDRFNITYDDKCPFTAPLSKKDRIELGQMKSYTAYQVAIFLFGLDKCHVEIKDRETISVKLPSWFAKDFEVK